MHLKIHLNFWQTLSNPSFKFIEWPTKYPRYLLLGEIYLRTHNTLQILISAYTCVICKFLTTPTLTDFHQNRPKITEIGFIVTWVHRMYGYPTHQILKQESQSDLPIKEIVKKNNKAQGALSFIGEWLCNSRFKT